MRAYDITISTQDLRYLTWDEDTRPSGLFVPEPTAREGVGSNAILYRLNIANPHANQSPQDEVASVNELISCRLMDAMGIPHVDTRLIRARVIVGGVEQEQWVTRYKSLRQVGASALPVDLFFELSDNTGRDPLEMCEKKGWTTTVAQIMVVDYLTANRGRGALDTSVQASPEGACSLALPFGGRQSLTSSFIGQTWRINATADISTDNYLGSRSLDENLRWAIGVLKASDCLPTCIHEKAKSPDKTATIQENALPCEHLTERTRRALFRSLKDAFPPMTAQQEGSWQIIRKRWERYARLCRL